ncbi:hypothetical protein EF405_06435 [Cyclobacteriaceae bacterium YHN15]|nr:hypothetical protein EF405_06435 [Cyclobacteriaceae bacterium YHN15]
MKNQVLNLLGLALLTMAFGACNNDEVTPIVDPIIGEWVAAEEQFLTIKVDGEEKSMLEFGMEVLRTNEAGAEEAAKEYLQNTILGPIDFEEPKLLFSSSNQFSAVLASEEIEGTWTFQNARTVLKLKVPDLDDHDFNFNLRKLSANELVLDWEWEMIFIGEGETYDVALKIKLVK